jgi:hypothetical protein
MLLTKISNNTSGRSSARSTIKHPFVQRCSSSSGLNDELGTLFRQICERTAPLLREKLRTPVNVTTNGVEYDTANDSLLGTHFSAFEAAAAYLARGGEFYIRRVSPIDDGIITFENSEIATITTLLAYWFYRPFPTFPDLVAFAGEYSRGHSIGEIAWMSLEDNARPWPEWLKALIEDPKQQEVGSG